MKEFFRGVDTTGIVEGHAKTVVDLQDSEARRIIRAYGEVRRDLIERLSHARFNSFTAHRLRSVLAQVNAAIDALNQKLKHHLDASAQKASVMSVEQLVKEIKRFDSHFKGATRPINLNIVKSAMDTKEFLINHYQNSLSHYGDSLKQDISNSLKQAVIAEIPYSEVVQKLSQEFQAQEWEVHRLARTELHHIYSVAKLNGMKDLKKEKIMPSIKKALYHPMDSRTAEDSKEMAEKNPIVELNDYFTQDYRPTPKSKVQHRRYLVPPDRPNDRAILIPYDPSWGQGGASSGYGQQDLTFE
jgi:hypothetical protein